MDITHCTLKYILEYESNATRYLQRLSHGPSIRLCDYARGTSDLVIKTLVCLLKTDVTNTKSTLRRLKSIRLLGKCDFVLHV